MTYSTTALTASGSSSAHVAYYLKNYGYFFLSLGNGLTNGLETLVISKLTNGIKFEGRSGFVKSGVQRLSVPTGIYSGTVNNITKITFQSQTNFGTGTLIKIYKRG